MQNPGREMWGIRRHRRHLGGRCGCCCRCRCHLNIKQTNLSHLICIHSFHLSDISSFVWSVGRWVDLFASQTYGRTVAVTIRPVCSNVQRYFVH